MSPVTYSVDRWVDPVVTECGYAPAGPYLLYRHLADMLRTPTPQEVGVVTLGALLGVSPSTVVRTVFRLKQYGLVRLTPPSEREPATLAVRTALPPLTMHQRRRLNPAHPLYVEPTP